MESKQTDSEHVHDRPIFVFTMHRSGGTLLARILNVHPDVVIWGEHGGWINKLAETDATLGCIPEILRPIAERNLKAYSSGEASGSFAPWTSPFERDDFRKFSRDLIRSTMAKGTEGHQRWGFKEIRYHQPITAKFLSELFPMARFILLHRSPISIVTSSIMASWSTKGTGIPSHRDPVTIGGTIALTRAILDCSYAVAVMENGFRLIEEELPEKCLTIEYDLMRDSIDRILDFLLLDSSPTIRRNMDEVFKIRAGKTPEAGNKRKLFIETIAAWGVRRSAYSILSHGVDWGRLKRLKSGRYSFLLGDHYLKNTPWSSMF